jgi:hypothetical protein
MPKGRDRLKRVEYPYSRASPRVSKKRSLTGQTRLVPIPSIKRHWSIPKPSPYYRVPIFTGKKVFRTKPGHHLVHPFVWPHRSSTGRRPLIGNSDLLRVERARGGGRTTTPRPDVGGVDDSETHLVRQSRIRQKQGAAFSRTGFSEIRRHGILRARTTLTSSTSSRNE